jgi:hypothetical protein
MIGNEAVEILSRACRNSEIEDPLLALRWTKSPLNPTRSSAGSSLPICPEVYLEPMFARVRRSWSRSTPPKSVVPQDRRLRPSR